MAETPIVPSAHSRILIAPGKSSSLPLLRPMDQPPTPAPFLRSLRRILDSESFAVVAWTPDGRAFEIHDVAAIAKYVLPQYFKHANYSSFQRQLNYFGFRKWTRLQSDVCTFSNALFQRDAPELMRHIVRKKSKPMPRPPPPTTTTTSSTTTSSSTSRRTARSLEPIAFPFKDTTATMPASPTDATTLCYGYYPSPMDASYYYYPFIVGSAPYASYSATELLTSADPLTSAPAAEGASGVHAEGSLEWLDALYSSLGPVVPEPTMDEPRADWHTSRLQY